MAAELFFDWLIKSNKQRLAIKHLTMAAGTLFFWLRWHTTTISLANTT